MNDEQIKSKVLELFATTVKRVVQSRLLDGSSPHDAQRTQHAREVSVLPASAAQATFTGVVCELADGEIVEYLLYSDGNAQPTAFAVSSCTITYEDLAPTQLVEYCFSDETPFPTWHVSKLSKFGFDSFIECKFKIWEKSLREPDCEAAFRRLLQRGIVYQTYDPSLFPSPPHLAEKYVITDEKTGKPVSLPHPVARCRVWNAAKQDYDELDTRLQGAPESDEAAKLYWESLLNELKLKRGAEYIESLLSNEA